MPAGTETGRAFRRPTGEWRRPVSFRAAIRSRPDRSCCRRRPGAGGIADVGAGGGEGGGTADAVLTGEISRRGADKKATDYSLCVGGGKLSEDGSLISCRSRAVAIRL